MSREIRIHVEGGGDARETKQDLRRGFGEFLSELRDKAREERICWTIVACGSKRKTLDFFDTAIKQHPDAFNVVLVDSDGPVTGKRLEHLRDHDQLEVLGVHEEQCHLMVQIMEAWFLCDPETLKEYYGQGFRERPIPKTTDVEQIDRDEVKSILREATRGTKTKGEYHKTRHAPEILERIDASKVRNRSHHCRLLFDTIEDSFQE